MQVSVETGGALERSLTVQVPEERIAAEVEERLQSMTKTTRVKGFRPGKAPLRVIRQRFGPQVRKEVLDKVLQSSFYEAVAQEKLRPAGAPLIAPLAADSGQGLSYTARFEVMPEVKLNPVEQLNIQKLVCEVSDDDVSAMIEKLRQQRAELQPVERSAQKGDWVNLDYKGGAEDGAAASLEAKGALLELGSGRFPGAFEDQLVGAGAGDSLTLNLDIPEDYGREELAGKTVALEVKVNSVSAPVLPELNEAFFKNFGVAEGDMEAFRGEIRKHVEREAELAARACLRDSVMDALREANQVELPKVLVDGEIHRIKHELAGNLKVRGVPEKDIDAAVEKAAPQFEETARRRVALRLLTAELIRAQDLKPAPEKVRAIIERNAQNYEDSSSMINWYYSDKERLAEIEALALEDEVIAWVASRGKVEESRLSFDELMNKRQTGADGASQSEP